MITSTRNPRVQAAARLHRRRNRAASGQTVLEGPGAIAEALAADVEIVDGFRLADDTVGADLLGARAAIVSAAVLARIAGTEHPRGPVATVGIPESVVAPGDAVVLIGVGDPGNAGTLIRTAAAFGFGVLSTPGTVDVWSPKVLRAGAGAHFQTPIGALGADWPDRCGEGGRRLVALLVSGGDTVDVLAGTPVALLVGDEASGLDEDAVSASDIALTIPMPGGTESLNAAVAASIAMYERSLRR